MSRRRGEITGLMNDSSSNSRLTIVRLSDDHRFFVTILIFFVFFVLEASVSPKGASDAIGTQPEYLRKAMKSAKRAIEMPLNTTH